MREGYQKAFTGLDREFEKVDNSNCSPEAQWYAYSWLNFMMSVLTDRFNENAILPEVMSTFKNQL